MAMECIDNLCTFHDKDAPFCHEKECWKKTLNLCDTCEKNRTMCDGIPKFGNGIGNNNVYICHKYVYKYDWGYDIDDPNSWLETGEPSTYTFLSEENKHEHRRKVLFEKARAVKEFTLFIIVIPVIVIFSLVICVVPWLMMELLDFMERIYNKVYLWFIGTRN